jgi:hypothetical protein
MTNFILTVGRSRASELTEKSQLSDTMAVRRHCSALLENQYECPNELSVRTKPFGFGQVEGET